MVALKPIEELKKRKEALLREQDELIRILKEKHQEAHAWMKANNIDPFNLKVHSASLAAAMLVGMAAVTQTPQIPQLIKPVTIIEVNELQGLSEEKKADIVWDRYGHVITRNAEKYELDPKLIFATIMLESGGDTYAIRQEPTIGDASYGLGQILYGTALGIGFEGTPQDLYDPEVNIELVARYHKRNQDVYGGNLTSVELTTAYNSGSPYNTPLPGHLAKFNKWFNKVDTLI